MTDIPEKKDVVENRVRTIQQESFAPAIQTPMEMISMAIKNGAGEKELAILERMFEFDVRVKEQQAKEAYYKAMSAWKASDPKILKDKRVSFQSTKGDVNYNYASLGNVSEVINKSMSPFGLSASWRLDQPEGKIQVTGKITHNLGHSESTSLTADADTSGTKNSIQALGSTISYLERYTILALAGLATDDMDDDGKSAVSHETISDEQFKQIHQLIKKYSINEKLFCNFMKIESIDKMPQSMFEVAIAEIEENQKKKMKLKEKNEPVNVSEEKRK